MLKYCNYCKEEKPLSEFYIKARKVKYPDSIAGYDSGCKPCRRKKQTSYRNSSLENSKGIDLYHSYRIRLDDYNLMFSNQKGCCGICGTHQSELKRALDVDHSHTTGKVRGLLCSSCNTGIGKLKENIEVLEKAISYLKNTELADNNTNVVSLGSLKKVG